MSIGSGFSMSIDLPEAFATKSNAKGVLTFYRGGYVN